MVSSSSLRVSAHVLKIEAKHITTDGARFNGGILLPPYIAHQIIDLSLQPEGVLVCYQLLSTCPDVGSSVGLVVLVIPFLGVNKDRGRQQLGGVLCPIIMLVSAMNALGYGHAYDR